MKNKNSLKNIVLILLGGIIFSSIGALAVTIINANQIGYTNTKGSATNVKEALDELYNMSSNGASCVLSTPPPDETLGLIRIVYYDPVEDGPCDESTAISTPGTKTGCMKWYAFKQTADEYTMILDHNTTAKEKYSAMSTELNNLKNDSGWKVTPRMITADEVGSIADYKIAGTSSTPSKYHWLYDYTSGCTSKGCKIEDSSSGGYWTSTKGTAQNTCGNVYRVGSDGTIQTYCPDNLFGLRPVITIPKSKL